MEIAATSAPNIQPYGQALRPLADPLNDQTVACILTDPPLFQNIDGSSCPISGYLKRVGDPCRHMQAVNVDGQSVLAFLSIGGYLQFLDFVGRMRLFHGHIRDLVSFNWGGDSLVASGMCFLNSNLCLIALNTGHLMAFHLSFANRRLSIGKGHMHLTSIDGAAEIVALVPWGHGMVVTLHVLGDIRLWSVQNDEIIAKISQTRAITPLINGCHIPTLDVIALASMTGQVFIYRLNDDKQLEKLAVINAHAGWITAISCIQNADNSAAILASVGEDHVLSIFSLASSQLKQGALECKFVKSQFLPLMQPYGLLISPADKDKRDGKYVIRVAGFS